MGYRLRGYIYKSISNMGYDRLSGLIYHWHLHIHAEKGWEGRSIITQSMSWIGDVCKENRDIWNLQIFHTKKVAGIAWICSWSWTRWQDPTGPSARALNLLTNQGCVSHFTATNHPKSRCGAVATSTPTHTIWFYRLPTCMAQLGRQSITPRSWKVDSHHDWFVLFMAEK